MSLNLSDCFSLTNEEARYAFRKLETVVEGLPPEEVFFDDENMHPKQLVFVGDESGEVTAYRLEALALRVKAHDLVQVLGESTLAVASHSSPFISFVTFCLVFGKFFSALGVKLSLVEAAVFSVLFDAAKSEKSLSDEHLLIELQSDEHYVSALGESLTLPCVSSALEQLGRLGIVSINDGQATIRDQWVICRGATR